jgi:hypothetical protein
VLKLRDFAQSTLIAATILVITGCSNQSDSCKAILSITQKATLVAETAKTGKREELTNIAKGMDQLATELEGLNVSQEKVQIYQDNLVQSYRDTGQALRSIVAAVNRPSADAVTSAVKALDKTTSRNEVLLQEARKICPS